MTDPLLTPDDLDALRTALAAADYSPDGVTARLGAAAGAALYRGDLRAVRHALGGDTGPPDPLGTLIALFPAGATLPADAVAAALHPLPLAHALATGLVEPAPTGRNGSDGRSAGAPGPLRAGQDLRPYGDEEGTWWVVSDLGSDVRPGPLRRDHVLGIGGASVTLAGATVRPEVATALDLGTGCGIQALHLSRHAAAVTGTDVSRRALRFAATTAALNDLTWELREGDLAAPVAGRRFDLVVSNPPFVVGPGGAAHATHDYRDSGRAGDGVTAELLAALPGLLTEGGHAQLLANWVHPAGAPWQDRVAGWLDATGCDAFAVQREVLDPAAYVALWLRDAGELDGPGAQRRTSEWLDWFAATGIEAVGFGLISLHASGADQPTVRVEEALQEVSGPLGGEIAGWFERVGYLRGADLLGTALVAAPGLRLHQTALGAGPSAEEPGWQVDRQVLALETGWRWAQEVDPITVELVGMCDGGSTLGALLALVAATYDADPAALAAVAVPLAGRLVERGMLLPAGSPPPARAA